MVPDDGNAGSTRPWNVFVSSTVRDFETFRAAVRDDLSTYAEAACFLSEDWVGGFDDTIAKCQRRVQQADAFLLLLGYWYGSVPPGTEKSVTHIEFESALAKWTSKFPPVAVMCPRPATEADQELAALAKEILDKRVLEGLDVADHDKKRSQFRTSVESSWRTINQFGTREELTKQAITCALRWQGRTFDRAAAGEVAGIDLHEQPGAVSEANLGRLGRKAQFDEVSDALALVAAERQCPGIALVAHGSPDAGQAEFLSALAEVEPALKRFRPGQLPVRQCDVARVTGWAAEALGIENREGLMTPTQLAEPLFAALAREPLGFILDRIGFVQGGLPAFVESFWTPLHKRLETLAAGQPFQHQVVVVIGDGSGDATAVNRATQGAAAGLPDYSKPIRLAPLGNITRVQLLTWLKDMNAPANRRAAIADAVLKNDQGQDDGTPLRVFARLRKEKWND